eukprot:TRINITY_DN35661_c0_g1_i1.p1 TRINITY_DN35661_c0_g1~~TRINITY_DN35661_c0_g1_i1.p1  ORF type:complete len:358 (+),score=70.81 TRINITY_DN35661_c0_g1_i1:129-1076(+)
MGVDSGLGTFRGRNAGVWPPLRALGIDFSEMSCPRWFEDDPLLAWAFWRFRHQAYTKAEPHAGYGILARWGAQMKHGLFSVTSNIDGHWDRTKGVGPALTYECHGTVTRMQPVSGSGVWKTDGEQIAQVNVPEWDLEPGDKVQGRVRGGEWREVVVAEDGCSLQTPAGEPCTVTAVRRPGGPDLCRALPGSPLPVTSTGAPARPNVLMFGDWGVDHSVISEASDRYQRWVDAIPKQVKLAVVEIGAGTAVSTIRYASESVLDSHEGATLVRINLDQSDVPKGYGDRAVAVGGMGALEALTAIDKLLQERDARFRL